MILLTRYICLRKPKFISQLTECVEKTGGNRLTKPSEVSDPTPPGHRDEGGDARVVTYQNESSIVLWESPSFQKTSILHPRKWSVVLLTYLSRRVISLCEG